MRLVKLIKIGAKVVSHGRYIAFQMAEVAISRHLFGDILRLIATLRAPPIPATATSPSGPSGAEKINGRFASFWPCGYDLAIRLPDARVMRRRIGG
jgi:hypothetical protein